MVIRVLYTHTLEELNIIYIIFLLYQRSHLVYNRDSDFNFQQPLYVYYKNKIFKKCSSPEAILDILTAQKIQICGATVNMEEKNSFISEANSHPAGTDWLPNLQVAFEYMCIPSSLFFLNFFNPESCANTCSRNVTFHTHFLDPSFFSVCNTGIRSVCSPFVLLQQLQ